MNTPKISVCITTYNHEDFIAQALDSVLEQSLNWPIEIIVGEDGSIDATKEIVESYASQHEYIRAFYRDEKDKIYLHGRPTGRFNFIQNIKQAEGEYIALLDGDDYWANPEKLTTQARILDSHPGISIVFHRVVNSVDGSSGGLFPSQERYPEGIYSTNDLLENNFIATASVMFRRKKDFSFPEYLYRVPYADWPLHLLNSRSGNVYLLDDVMAVRREHGGGRWSSSDKFEQYRWDIEFFYEMSRSFQIEYISHFRSMGEKKLKDLIRETIKEKGIVQGLRERLVCEERIREKVPWKIFMYGLAGAILRK
jgi:glycosyltransferase involved in cell wall biosynthesis